jgi:hypothetical protein
MYSSTPMSWFALEIAGEESGGTARFGRIR